MIRGTTPDFIIRVNADLRSQRVYVTFRQMRKAVTKEVDPDDMSYDGEETVIAVRLTQEHTLSLGIGTAEVQVRAIDSQGVARATVTAEVTIDKVLQEGVIRYAE